MGLRAGSFSQKFWPKLYRSWSWFFQISRQTLTNSRVQICHLVNGIPVEGLHPRTKFYSWSMLLSSFDLNTYCKPLRFIHFETQISLALNVLFGSFPLSLTSILHAFGRRHRRRARQWSEEADCGLLQGRFREQSWTIGTVEKWESFRCWTTVVIYTFVG